MAASLINRTRAPRNHAIGDRRKHHLQQQQDKLNRLPNKSWIDSHHLRRHYYRKIKTINKKMICV